MQKFKWVIITFEVVIGISLVIIFIVSIVVDIKRLKVVRENTEVYKELNEKVSKTRTDVSLYVESQKANSISFDELVKRLEETLKSRKMR